MRRRRRACSEHIERASVVRALRALERAEIGAAGDRRRRGHDRAGRARRRLRLGARAGAGAAGQQVGRGGGRPSATRRAFAERIDQRYPSLAVVPKLFISALTGARRRAHLGRHRRASPAQLPRPPADAEASTRSSSAPSRPGRRRWCSGVRPRFFYATQTATAPPTITVFGSDPSASPPSTSATWSTSCAPRSSSRARRCACASEHGRGGSADALHKSSKRAQRRGQRAPRARTADDAQAPTGTADSERAARVGGGRQSADRSWQIVRPDSQAPAHPPADAPASTSALACTPAPPPPRASGRGR